MNISFCKSADFTDFLHSHNVSSLSRYLYNFSILILKRTVNCTEEMALFSDKRFLMGILTNVVWKKVKSRA